MNKKIYALYFKLRNTSYSYDAEITLKISSEKHWLSQSNLLEQSKDKVVQYNDCHYISYSRAALVKKAEEIKANWIDIEKERLSKIENITIT